jgi:gamma-glutamyltranspeptidase / glutathione hydrolase
MPRRTLPGLLATIAVLAVPVGAGAEPYRHTTQPTARGTDGAAATGDSVATTAATDALRAGGNAVDAAVAAAAVLGVTEPFSSGIGGGGFMLIRKPGGKVTTIGSREKSPTAMQESSFMEDGAALAFDDARYSGLSAGVPGTVAGWDRALRKYGTWSLRRALRRGIRVARKGFVIDRTFNEQAEANAAYFDDIRSSERLYLDPDGTAHDVGTIQRNPGMARAYRRIGRRGVAGFYRGPIAAAITRAVQSPPLTAGADHVWRPGLMTPRDLREYTAPERKPTHIRYRGLDVFGMGPPSSGGSTVGEGLNLLEHVPGYAQMSDADKMHYFLEASRYSFADRNAYLADPAYFDVPLSGLLSKDYAATRRALIKDTAAAGAVPPGDPYPFEGAETTTHLTTSDKSGNVVSYTFTIESTGGSGLVVPGFGFLLNNELTDFNFDSTTHPNRVEGGKRPRSSMSPTIVTRGGEPFLAVGSPGGATIITTVLQILLDRIDLGMTLPQAIADPRASQRNAVNTGAEPAFLLTPERTALEGRGHHFVNAGEIGAAAGIEFLTGGRVLAAAEPVRRGGGSALAELP